jgi:hypothetical protein
MKTVTIIHEYAASADAVWELVTDYQALAEVMEGVVAFDGLPKGRTKTGQSIEVKVSLFGKLPTQPYLMEVLECSDETMTLRSSERGAGVKSWKHTLTVFPIEAGCRLQDHIVIDAGLMTPLFALWARYLYRARHKPRLRMLGLSPQ